MNASLKQSRSSRQNPEARLEFNLEEATVPMVFGLSTCNFDGSTNGDGNFSQNREMILDSSRTLKI
jgi:hypothetical protein